MVPHVARIGPYELVRRLGRGGMAETFQARRRGPGGFVQDCCLKRVLPELAGDAAFRDQFLDEATIHGRLQHGNIVRVSDFGEEDGTYFLVMELVDGCDLADLLEHARARRERLPVEVVLTLAADLCQALAYAHTLEDEQGRLDLVHRDLTPSNVLLNRAGEVKLSDFGIARAAQRRHRTQTGYTKGKFCYMSPEQIEAREDLDGRSDLFALGCVLYEMLAGERPFDAPSGNDLAVLPRILEGSFEPLRERAPDVPAELASLVHALLARERDDRPQDAQAVLEALAPLMPAITVRGEIAARVRAVVQARDEAAARGSGELPATAQVDLEAPTKRSYVGEPTQPARVREAPEGGGTPAGWEPPASPRGPSSRALLALAASLVVLGLVVLGLLLRPQGAPRPTDEAAAQLGSEQARGQAEAVQPQAAAAEPEPPASQVAATPVEPPPAPSPEVADAPSAPQPTPEEEPALTDLRVVVVPYGTIWIDGKPRGHTRVRVTLPAGRHRIGVGRGESPSRSEEVLLEPGKRTLEFALDDSFQ